MIEKGGAGKEVVETLNLSFPLFASILLANHASSEIRLLIFFQNSFSKPPTVTIGDHANDCFDTLSYAALIRLHTLSFQPESGFRATLLVPLSLSFQWDLPPPVHMSWTPDNDRLLVLGEDGTYRLYSLAAAAFASSSSSSSSPSGGVGAAYSQHTLGGVADVAEVGIVDARSCGDAGLVVLTGGLEFVFVRGWEGARGTAMAMAGERPPSNTRERQDHSC